MILEYCIIKQMDTSGRYVVDNTKKKGSDKLSKEELNAILKFGAQKMFQQTQEAHNLEDVDLDAILARADEMNLKEKEELEDSSRMELMEQFQVTQFGLDSLSWEDIIPEDDRKEAEKQERLNAEVEKQKQEEAMLLRKYKKSTSSASSSSSSSSSSSTSLSTRRQGRSFRESRRRRRTSSSSSDERGEDDDVGGGDESSTSSSMDPTSVFVSPRSTVSPTTSDPSNPPKSKSTTHRHRHDPRTHLNERDLRALSRALCRFGDIQLRPSIIVEDAQLVDKSLPFVVSTAQLMIETCEQAMHSLRLSTNPSSHATSSFNKPHRAVTVDFQGVMINASLLSARVKELTYLTDFLSHQPSQAMKPSMVMHSFAYHPLYQVFHASPPLLKPMTHWSVPWTSQDDALLILGVYHHGFGNWKKIKDDPHLYLTSKLFLDDLDKEKIPRQEHLARRAETVIKFMMEKTKSMNMTMAMPLSSSSSSTPHLSTSPSPQLSLHPPSTMGVSSSSSSSSSSSLTMNTTSPTPIPTPTSSISSSSTVGVVTKQRKETATSTSHMNSPYHLFSFLSFYF
ncbi:hypothetical protein HMI55_001787 [Coelomomyces lativittatus]|nr:hypothetical protein HMI55_001787 [Coelomomyces lativittatus]